MAAAHDTCAARHTQHIYSPVGEMASVSRSSIHGRFIAGFVRQTSGHLIHCFGPFPTRISPVWPQIRDHVLREECRLRNRLSRTSLPIKYAPETADSMDRVPPSHEYLVFEMPRLADGQVIGLVLAADSSPTPQSLELDEFFADLVLRGLRVDIKTHAGHLRDADADLAADAIVHRFDTSLRYVGKHDKWLRGGRDVFRRQVRSFTSRGARVEFCLPAFPCKSSSTEKVLSQSPDRGEYVALSNLQRFLQEVEDIYGPGAKLWIISDGHVFSDCIGVDDGVVDQYGAELQAMNETIAHRLGGKDRIGFRSLPELFDYDGLVGASELPLVTDPPPKPRLVGTKTTVKAEVCRRILDMGFRPGDAEPMEDLVARDPALLALYRGFSKFMLEDLATNQYTRHLSRSQLRRKASEVAKEMMQRNQAYSNLVEIMFPHHVRLSIHAHDNAGPKFGIKMLGKHVIPTDVIPPTGEALDCCDHLHIPTPWHNCMVEIDGRLSLYTTKASAVWPAVRSGDATWVNGGECGSYVYFKKMESVA
ncbi:Pyoverdine biosynthesis, partial [Metarhizium majus ARSEF 297]